LQPVIDTEVHLLDVKLTGFPVLFREFLCDHCNPTNGRIALQERDIVCERISSRDGALAGLLS
jgi:hypothetical protein